MLFTFQVNKKKMEETDFELIEYFVEILNKGKLG